MAIRVNTPDELARTIYGGTTDLEAYFARNPALGSLRSLPRPKVGGVRFVLHAGRLLGFHRGNLYEIVLPYENATTPMILSSLRFK